MCVCACFFSFLDWQLWHFVVCCSGTPNLVSTSGSGARVRTAGCFACVCTHTCIVRFLESGVWRLHSRTPMCLCRCVNGLVNARWWTITFVQTTDASSGLFLTSSFVHMCSSILTTLGLLVSKNVAGGDDPGQGARTHGA